MCPAGSAVRNQRADRGVRPYESVTFELFRCEAPELLHLPEATFDWYCRNYLDRDYPLRMILRLNGVEFPERLG